jgi:hypothetical protein
MKSKYTIENLTQNNVLLPGVKIGPNMAYVVPVTPNGPVEIPEAAVENHSKGLRRAMKGLVRLYYNGQRITIGILSAWLEAREKEESEARAAAKVQRAEDKVKATKQIATLAAKEREDQARAVAAAEAQRVAEVEAQRADPNHVVPEPERVPLAPPEPQGIPSGVPLGADDWQE